MKLMFALHCWLQRTTVQISLLNFDVHISIGQATAEAPSLISDTTEGGPSAHRAILATGSPKFASMLRFLEAQGVVSSPLSSSTCKVLTLHMEGVSAFVANALNTFIYTGTLPDDILSGECDRVDSVLVELVEVADQHILPQLTAVLCRLLISRISGVHNVLRYYDVARTHGLSSVATMSSLYWLKQCSGDCCAADVRDVAGLVEEMLLFLLQPK